MNKFRISIIVIAVVWAAVVLAIGMVLGGTPHMNQVIALVDGGVAATLIVLGRTYRKSAKA
ncbi:MAG: hypothetical protein ABSD98_01445 [Candidatus Korobacteraceae bacterium]